MSEPWVTCRGVQRYRRSVSWPVESCRELAGELLALLPERWQHVCAVGSLTEAWFADGRVTQTVVKAAWLHDVGYSERLARTGMHAIDGAAYLDLHGVDRDVVALVAQHTGAWFEAEERGLTGSLLTFDMPDQDELDALTLADLLTGPNGERVTLDERFEGIFSRYEPQHPVHRAVTRSRRPLTKRALRAASRVGYPM